MKSNANLSPIPVFVHNAFLFDGNLSQTGVTSGHLISVRAQQNQALQFSVLLANGALFTGLPAHAITFSENAPNGILELSDVQMWDCVSSGIDVCTFDTLRYMKCSVRGNRIQWNNCVYLFTVDFVGDGFSRHPEHWKQLHALKASNGDFLLYPQYRIKFTDEGICPSKDIPKYKANTKHWIVGS